MQVLYRAINIQDVDIIFNYPRTHFIDYITICMNYSIIFWFTIIVCSLIVLVQWSSVKIGISNQSTDVSFCSHAGSILMWVAFMFSDKSTFESLLCSFILT